MKPFVEWLLEMEFHPRNLPMWLRGISGDRKAAGTIACTTGLSAVASYATLFALWQMSGIQKTDRRGKLVFCANEEFLAFVATRPDVVSELNRRRRMRGVPDGVQTMMERLAQNLESALRGETLTAPMTTLAQKVIDSMRSKNSGPAMCRTGANVELFIKENKKKLQGIKLMDPSAT